MASAAWSSRVAGGFRDGRARRLAQSLLPCLAAGALLLLGYLHYAPGAQETARYQQPAYANLRYSDIVWLYLRDHLARHPIPYVDYRLEYPVLLGLWMYLLSFSGSIAAFFAANYALLAACALGAVALLGLLPGADRWRLALAPALFLYTGLNWDLAAIGALAGALVLLRRRHDRAGTLLLVVAVWLKLFPLAFLVAVLFQRLRTRQFRRAAEIGVIFGAGSLLLNAPLALARWANWSYFFTFNDDRGGNFNIWVLWPRLSVGLGDLIGIALLLVGGLALLALAWRARVDVVVPLGVALLLWWLAVNKIFSPQYVLWVFFGLALIRAAWPLWTALAVVDLAHFGVSWLLLYTASFPGNNYLVRWQNHELRTPIVLGLDLLILVAVAQAALLLLRAHRVVPEPLADAPALLPESSAPEPAHVTG